MKFSNAVEQKRRNQRFCSAVWLWFDADSIYRLSFLPVFEKPMPRRNAVRIVAPTYTKPRLPQSIFDLEAAEKHVSGSTII